MKDLCHDVFGVLKEKKDPKDVKGNRGNNYDSFMILHVGLLGTPHLDCKQNCSDVCYMFPELLDVFPEKRGYEDGGYMSDEEKEVCVIRIRCISSLKEVQAIVMNEMNMLIYLS